MSGSSSFRMPASNQHRSDHAQLPVVANAPNDPQAAQYRMLMRAARAEGSNLKRQAGMLADERKLLSIERKIIAIERDLLRKKTHIAETSASISALGGATWFLSELAPQQYTNYFPLGNVTSTVGLLIAAGGVMYWTVRMHFIDRKLAKIPKVQAKLVDTFNAYRRSRGAPNADKYATI